MSWASVGKPSINISAGQTNDASPQGADGRRVRLSVALPITDDAMIWHDTFSESDVTPVRQHRGHHNRFGFAVQWCSLRDPGFALPRSTIVPPRQRFTWRCT